MKIFVSPTLPAPDQERKNRLIRRSELKKNRRKSENDRRHSADKGITVRLSTRIERRLSRERRERGPKVQDFVTLSKNLLMNYFVVMAELMNLSGKLL